MMRKSTANNSNMINQYKNGTYVATGSYVSPGGLEEVGVKLILKDDIITDVYFESKAVLPTSKKMQEMFGDNYKPMVVGKKISELKLGKISGSSLTPVGFNDAIAKIEVQATL